MTDKTKNAKTALGCLAKVGELIEKSENNKKKPKIIKSEYAKKLGPIANDIINMKIEDTDTIKKCKEKFFTIMRKYGIKNGTPVFDKKGKCIGGTHTNYEWSICFYLFMENLKGNIEMPMLFGNNIPSDLYEYEYEK